MTGRETAWRVFAAELLAATVEERGEGERAATYVVTPAGARANRVLMAGTLGEGQPVGSDPARSFVRAELADPSGAIEITAGTYQPRALLALRAWSVGRPALVVGKPRLPRAPSGAARPSVRAEAIRPLDAAELLDIQAEISEQTAARLALVEDLRTPRALPESDLKRAPPLWVAGARRAARAYAQFDLRALHDLVRARPASPGVPLGSPGLDAPSRGGATRRTAPTGSPPTAAERAAESAFLDLIDELAETSSDGCAELRETVQRAAERGVTGATAEELVNRLEAAGVLEEPVVGRLRRVSSGGTP